MPQILFFAAIGALAWMGYKSMLRSAERVHDATRRANKEASNKASGTLVKDPATGEYRLRRD